MDKDRELQDETRNSASRRAFLHQAAEVGLVVAASVASQAGTAETASRRRRGPRGSIPTDTPANAGVYHIVSDIPHPSLKQGEVQHYLALRVDSKNHIVLDEAKEGNGQIWEVLIDTSGGGQLRRAHHDAGGYLALDGNGGLTLSDRYTDAFRWWWMKNRDTPGYVYIQQGADANKVIYAALSQNKLPGAVSLAQRSADPKAQGYRWKIIPAHGDGIPEGTLRLAESMIPHVLDQCDITWHNPACPGNPGTWTGCVTNGTTCTCTHA